MTDHSTFYAVKRRLVATASIAVLLFFAFSATVAAARVILPENPVSQEEKPLHEWRASHALARLQSSRTTPLTRDDRPLDVLHYTLDLTVSDESDSLWGEVTVELRALAPLATVELDLFVDSIEVLEVRQEGSPSTYTHVDDILFIEIPGGLAAEQVTTLSVRYRGEPIRFGFMGYEVSQFSRGTVNGKPVIQTLSEPKSARSWWPCHDTPFDAATMTIQVTAPEALTVVAPGPDRSRVTELDLGGGLKRTTHEMTTPIPAYLMSLAISEYQFYSETARVTDFDSQTPVDMPVEYYVAQSADPIDFPIPFLEDAQFAWGNTVEMIETFDSWFGPYPYSDLKYGMAMFRWGGAMEHPTVSSIGQGTVDSSLSPYSQYSLIGDYPRWEWIVAHEMAHQWFGDCVRVERWGEIWLNEGFASYVEMLWQEHKYGYEAAKNYWLDNVRDWAPFPGTVIDPQPVIFGNLAYKKGSAILHMLRQVYEVRFPGEGRDKLLEAMRSYVTDPQLRFDAVRSTDFQFHAEGVYGESLDWFFQPWLYGNGQIALATQWYQDGDELDLHLVQPGGSFYRFPVPVRIHTDDGGTVDTTVWMDEANTYLQLSVTGTVTDIEIDAERDWLLDVSVSPVGAPVAVELLPSYPNPFFPLGAAARMSIPVFLRTDAQVEAAIFDVRGRRVRTLWSGTADGGFLTLDWDGRDDESQSVSSGVYFIRVAVGDSEETDRLVLLR